MLSLMQHIVEKVGPQYQCGASGEHWLCTGLKHQCLVSGCKMRIPAGAL